MALLPRNAEIGKLVRIADGMVLWAVGYAALVILTRSLLLAMSYDYHLLPVMAVAGVECLVAAALAFFTRQVAVGLGALVGVLAVGSVNPGVRAWLARAWAWAQGGLAALVEWTRGTPPVLTADLAWAGAFLAPLAVATLVLGFCARGRDPLWPLVAGAVIPVLEWFSFFDRGLDFLAVYLVLAAGWLAAWRVTAGGAPGPAGAAPARPAALSERLTAMRAAVWVGLVTAVILVPARGLAPYPAVSPGRVADWFVETIPGLGRLRGGAAVQTVGFNPDTRRLGGPVAPGSRVAMQVRITRAEVRPLPVSPYSPQRLYLRGTVRDRYTGQGWESKPYRSTFPKTAGETPWLIRLGEGHYTFSLDVEVEVRPRDLPYLYLFAPWIPVEVEQEGTTLTTFDREITAARQPREYTVRARVPLHSWSELNVLAPIDRQWWAPYLELPSTLPPEVGEEARRVTAGAQTPYERASRLEEYLRTTFPYDQSVRRPDPDEDFVADFLFDLKKGYCVHHSTAMAVMLRTLGIPTRWVQGFVVDLATGTWMDVPQSSAHAWVEVFIPGCGWVTFDPTPRYPVPQREFTPVPREGGAGGPAPGRPGGGSVAYPGRPGMELEPDQPGEAGYLPGAGAPGFPWRVSLTVVGILGLAVPGGRCVFRTFLLRRAHRRRPGEPISAFILRQYRLTEHYLGLIGLSRPSWLTPREFLREFGVRSGEGGAHPGEEVCRALAALTASTEEAAFSPRGRPAPPVREAPPASRGTPSAGGWDGGVEAAENARVVAVWVRCRLGAWRWLRWLALGPPLPPT